MGVGVVVGVGRVSRRNIGCLDRCEGCKWGGCVAIGVDVWVGNVGTSAIGRRGGM